uniref:Serine/threonine-protein phosphatase n=1 Tax=Pseudo-nitzschia delicatissima TaxID=44447 RepID=A0A7S0UEX2_9STRA|mmetsp:Transcript_1497/g.3126  ORF Transcript_1497/g.3126 Transcript_1497/m.3126 type:complete len:347 (+) Transcript_1497:165-1205(+)
MGLDVDQCIATLKKGEVVSERELRQLCMLVGELLMEESNVQPITSPVTIVGDVHGQFFDLLNLFERVGGWPPGTSYIFLGDFVDRGHNSVETLSLLLCLKLKYPAHITLLRGNHESRQITQVYGFYDECLRKYGNASVWRHCVQCFDCFGLAALIDEKVLCVHGGLSPDVRTLDQVRAIDRNQEIPHEGAFNDLVWSDPEDIAGSWQLSPRGAGYLFGKRVTDEFHEVNNLQFLARAHQLVLEGRKYHFDKRLVTVWSAPNYCYRCGNVAAILEIGGSDEGNTTIQSSDDNSDDAKQQARDEITSSTEHEGYPGSINQRFKFFRETNESVHGPGGAERAHLVPYFL